MKVSFGAFTLNSETRQLRRGADEVHLSPKAFDLLCLLVERRPGAISKADLLEQLWPKTYITESNIAGLVAEIRRAIDDDARTPRFVRTVQRFGYAFAGEASAPEMLPPVEAAAGRASGSWLVAGERHVPLQDGENILGRDPETGGFDSITVSRRHARIVVTDGHATLEDLGSKNGTFLHGKRITSPHALADADQISLGSVPMTFRVARDGPSTRTWRRTEN